MKHHTMTLYVLLIMISGYLVLLLPQSIAAQEELEERSVDQEFSFVEGKARAVSVENNIITVKPNKGKKVEIFIDLSTVFKGASSLEDIEKNNRVKVWYVLDGEGRKAVKVEKLPELGC